MIADTSHPIIIIILIHTLILTMSMFIRYHMLPPHLIGCLVGAQHIRHLQSDYVREKGFSHTSGAFGDPPGRVVLEPAH